MSSKAITVLEPAHQRMKRDRAALALTLETLFKRYTTEGRHLPDGSLKTELYLEHVRQTGRYLANFFGRAQLVSALTPDRVHDYKDVAAAGGWRDTSTLLRYQRPDEETLRAVVEFDRPRGGAWFEWIGPMPVATSIPGAAASRTRACFQQGSPCGR